MRSVTADIVAGRRVAVAVSRTIWLGNIGGYGAVVIGNRAGVVGRMTNEERILALIRSSERALTDRDIREQTGIEPHAQVNQISNRLARKGLARREDGPQGSLVNRLVVEDEGAAAYPASARGKEREVGTLGSPEIDLGAALIVIPCSAKKHCGGAEDRDGVSILDFLPGDLSAELRVVRQRNARECGLDESLRMPAAERYCGSLYEAAGRTLAHVERAGAGLAIVSGGYGVVLAGEQIGWYEQRFGEARWPNELVGRCLAAYAEAIQARTVIGLFGKTTPYAKAFRSVKWPVDIHEARLVSPELREGGALVKVPRAIGESLAEMGSTGALGADWKSSDNVPVRITRVGTGGPLRAQRCRRETGLGGCRIGRVSGQNRRAPYGRRGWAESAAAGGGFGALVLRTRRRASPLRQERCRWGSRVPGFRWTRRGEAAKGGAGAFLGWPARRLGAKRLSRTR